MKDKHNERYEKHMEDWDNFSNKILIIFIVRLMINAHFKFNDKN
jgi:hypothetical protein